MINEKIIVFVENFIYQTKLLEDTQKSSYLTVSKQRVEALYNFELLNDHMGSIDDKLCYMFFKKGDNTEPLKLFVSDLIKEKQYESALFCIACFELILYMKNHKTKNLLDNSFVYQMV